MIQQENKKHLYYRELKKLLSINGFRLDASLMAEALIVVIGQMVLLLVLCYEHVVSRPNMLDSRTDRLKIIFISQGRLLKIQIILIIILVNPSNPEATFVQSTTMQRLLKTI